MPIKFLLFRGGGGVLGFLEGGGGCQFYFYGRGDFSDFGDFSIFWGLFGDSRPEGPRRFFLDFFVVFGPEGLKTPVDTQTGAVQMPLWVWSSLSEWRE